MIQNHFRNVLIYRSAVKQTTAGAPMPFSFFKSFLFLKTASSIHFSGAHVSYSDVQSDYIYTVTFCQRNHLLYCMFSNTFVTIRRISNENPKFDLMNLLHFQIVGKRFCFLYQQESASYRTSVITFASHFLFLYFCPVKNNLRNGNSTVPFFRVGYSSFMRASTSSANTCISSSSSRL